MLLDTSLITICMINSEKKRGFLKIFLNYMAPKIPALAQEPSALVGNFIICLCPVCPGHCRLSDV